MSSPAKPAPLAAPRSELTLRGLVLGVVITVVFTAANVYLGLKVGLTFATAIPAAVISMAILIDTMVPKSELLPQVQEAVTGLARGSLGPNDRVSIYALGCDLTLAADQITPDAKSLENAMNTAMAAWVIRQRAGSGVTASNAHSRACKPLWDALSYVTEKLHQQPGRRVLVTISDGADSGSNKAKGGWCSSVRR